MVAVCEVLHVACEGCVASGVMVAVVACVTVEQLNSGAGADNKIGDGLKARLGQVAAGSCEISVLF